MANVEPDSASVVAEGTSTGRDDNETANVQTEVEEKVDGLTLDEPTTEAAKKKKKNKSKKKKEPPQQTDPPSIPVAELFPSVEFPEGEIQQYKDETTSEEKRELERLEKPTYNSVRQAAEVHHQVRKYIRQIAKPGMLMIDLCETLENMVRKLISENGLQAGIAFPTGCSLNWTYCGLCIYCILCLIHCLKLHGKSQILALRKQGLTYAFVMLVLQSKRLWNPMK